MTARRPKRILTTHSGSLPRSRRLLELLVLRNQGKDVEEEFETLVACDMRRAIRAQADAGIDIANDGELPRTGFQTVVTRRMSGFGGESRRGVLSDIERFPKFAELVASRSRPVSPDGSDLTTNTSPGWVTPACIGRVSYDPHMADVSQELDQFQMAVGSEAGDFVETFVTAPTPGIVASSMLRSPENRAYATHRDYVMALADELSTEYRYIVDHGHLLQLDAPDLAMERMLMFKGRSEAEFLSAVALHVEALNRAIRGIPRDRVRLHVCWGNYEGPHVDDPELGVLLPLLYEANVGGLCISCANPRHQHNHRYLSAAPPPADMTIAVGVIDVTTNFVEHPEVVAQRLEIYAQALGDPTRIIATTDCGFGTRAGLELVAEDVVWAKLRAMRLGADLATERLM